MLGQRRAPHAAARTVSTVRRIGVVEDHASVVAGLSTLLRAAPDLEMVAGAATVTRLLAETTDLDLVVLDLRLEDGSSPTANVDLLTAAGIPALVFTGGEEPHLVRLAAAAGVLGVVRKSESNDMLLNAIRAAVRGETVATTDWAAAIDGDPSIESVGLSPRQRQVLELYASGESTTRVARIAGLKESTVTDYVRRIRVRYAEAGRPAPTRMELYKRALEDGYLPLQRRATRRR
ncbi:MAG: LuxR C-terminal-related transcriptional regulator [Rhodococcus sp. (in: high G+C Gram-positive bacteria)]|uniref:LuxR C-terminal-related transcriptional regulator n=1 Tax=Rhodococcus sp. TaxID=1831 RepID=UPI003BB7F398